jgi:starch synthase
MSKNRVLIVTQEMDPYTAITEIAEMARRLPQFIQENGMEIRILMPRYGIINERRHRLHEVVRLSGMNIIVDDDDFPLIIKVASLPEARMQVYFLDNEDFFKRKATLNDPKGNSFEDNVDRMVFFCKGVMETVKKFGWSPDIIHCHGWLTSLVPLYLKTAYKSEPLFQQVKTVYSVYNDHLDKEVSESFREKASISNLKPADLNIYFEGSELSLHQGASFYADAIVQGSLNPNEKAMAGLKDSGKPLIKREEETGMDVIMELYHALLEEKVSG